MPSLTRLLCLSLLAASLPFHAQSPAQPATPRAWIDAAAANEILIINDDGTLPLEYRVHKVDARGDITREVIESRQGTVARLLQRNGQPITADEDRAERDRLNLDITNPDEFLKHHHRDASSKDYSLQLLRQMPQAMVYTFANGQPPAPNATTVQIDFHSDPNYKPTSTICDLLTGVEGTLWLDAKTRRLTRITAHVTKQVNFGWGGVLARIYPGGTITFEQTSVGDRWVYSHVDEKLMMRALFVKSIPLNVNETAFDFRPMPRPVNFQDAVHQLLAMQIPLR